MVPDKVRIGEISRIKKIINRLKYGLLLQVIRNKLALIGIEIRLFYFTLTESNDIDIPEIKGMISEYTVEFLKEGEMMLMISNTRGHLINEFLSRLKEGKKCIGLKHSDNIVAFLWICLDKIDFEPINLPLKSNEAYFKEIHTFEPYRGNNYAAYLRYRSIEIMQKIGQSRFYSVVEYFNTSAKKYIRKTNARFLKLKLFIKLFNKYKWCFLIRSY